jgi:RNA recognition motif-containing protein
MQARLFIGTLGWNVSEADLAQLGSQHGEVLDAKVITDRDTGRSRGFGFMTIETDNVQDVIQALDGQEIDGRAIRVNEAEDKPRRDGGGFRGGSGGRGGGGGGGRRDRY